MKIIICDRSEVPVTARAGQNVYFSGVVQINGTSADHDKAYSRGTSNSWVQRLRDFWEKTYGMTLAEADKRGM